MLPHCRSLLVFAVAAVVAVAVPAHGQPTTGGLSGTVLGPDGAKLPGVVITVRGTPEGEVVARVVSADYGSYRVSALRAGDYELLAELAGFAAAPLAVTVTAGRSTTADLRMGLATLAEEVQVIGTAPRDSVEAPRLGESGARDLGEALGTMAGVWKVRRAGIASDVVLRGYQGENVSVLIDGMRLYGACPNNMDHTSFHVDFAEVDHVDVAKGPFEMKNQGGLGGAVNIVTRKPGPGLHVTPRLAAGSFGYVNPSLTASFGNRRLAVLGGYSYRASDIYEDGSGRPFPEGVNYKSTVGSERAFEVNTAWGRVDLSPSDSHAAQLSYTWQDAGLVLYPYLQMDALYDEANRVNLGYDYRSGIGPVKALRGQAYYTVVRHWMTDEYRLSSANMPRAYSMGTMARTETLGGKAEATFSRGTGGVEVFHRGWDTATMLAAAKYQPQFSIPNVSLTSAGAYGEFSQPIGAGLQLDLGARVDHTTNTADPAKANTSLYLAYHDTARTEATDTYPSGKARLSWHPAENLTLSGGIGRTVRVPDPQERYFALKRMGSDWVGDPGLDPTTNTGVDLHVSYRRPRLYVSGSLYRDSLDNFVAVYQQAKVSAVPGVMNAVARSWRNVDATMSGGEVESLFSLTDRLFLAAEVSAVRGRQRVDPAAGVTSPYISELPPARARAALRYDSRRERGGSFGEIEVIYSARQDQVDATLREIPTPPYAVVNLRAGVSVRSARVNAGIANLLDRTYYEHLSYQRDPFRSGARVYEPGRNVYVNLAVVF